MKVQVLVEMTLKWQHVASVHTTATFQAFNGLEHGMVGAWFFVRIPKRGRGSLCPALKGIPGTDRHASLLEVRTHTLTPEAIMGCRERFSLSLNDIRCRVTPGLKKKWKRRDQKNV